VRESEGWMVLKETSGGLTLRRVRRFYKTLEGVTNEEEIFMILIGGNIFGYFMTMSQLHDDDRHRINDGSHYMKLERKN
jgi:hypothetical protein